MWNETQRLTISCNVVLVGLGSLEGGGTSDQLVDEGSLVFRLHTFFLVAFPGIGVRSVIYVERERSQVSKLGELMRIGG